jgi:hypothetical protein
MCKPIISLFHKIEIVWIHLRKKQSCSTRGELNINKTYLKSIEMFLESFKVCQ